MLALLFLWWWVGCFVFCVFKKSHTLPVWCCNWDCCSCEHVFHLCTHVHILAVFSMFQQKRWFTAGKEEGLTQAAGDSQIRAALLHDFKPHKFQPSSQVSAVASSCRIPNPKDTMLTWCLLGLCWLKKQKRFWHSWTSSVTGRRS